MALVIDQPSIYTSQSAPVSAYQEDGIAATKTIGVWRQDDSKAWGALQSGSIGNKYTSTEVATEDDTKGRSLGGAVVSGVDDKLMYTWIDLTIESIEKFDDSFFGSSLEKSERYLRTLYNNDEYRMVISAHILNLKAGYEKLVSKDTVRTKYAQALKVYRKSSKKTDDRMKLVRTVRVLGITPSGA